MKEEYLWKEINADQEKTYKKKNIMNNKIFLVVFWLKEWNTIIFLFIKIMMHVSQGLKESRNLEDLVERFIMVFG